MKTPQVRLPIIAIVVSVCAVKSYAGFTINQAADLVLGQGTSFTTANVGNSASALSTPRDVATDPVTGKVFVADTSNHRVLRYSSSASLVSGAQAETVFGQENFGLSAPGIGQNRMDTPTGVFVDQQGRLWVADQQNHRVLRFDNASTGSIKFAHGLLGQTVFTVKTSGNSASKMNHPADIAMDASYPPNLWVADMDNNRVMGYRAPVEGQFGKAAEVVLGQPTWANSGSGNSFKKMNHPSQLIVSSTNSSSANTLWVADTGNNRVLRFDQVPLKENGALANGVLGQSGPDMGDPGLAINRFNNPVGVAVDNSGTLYVGDFLNNRVVYFNNAAAKEDGANADGLLGESVFDSKDSPKVTITSIRAPEGLATDFSGRLYVAQSMDNRVTRYTPVVVLPVNGTPTITVKKSIVTSKSPYTLKGKASSAVGIMKVQYKAGRAFKMAKGTTSWKAKVKLKTGTNKVTIRVTANNGQIANKNVKIKRIPTL